MHSPRRMALPIVLLVSAATALVAGRWHLLPKRFAVVVPGRVYRGGEQQRWPYRWILDEYDIKTIVNLNFPSSDEAWDELEAAEARKRGIERVGLAMSGDGVVPFEKLEEAAAILADPRRQPVFVHCSAGVQRTNAVCAVYRLKYCGWSLEETLAECERYWLSRDSNPELFAHLERYAEKLRSGRMRPQPSATQPGR